MVHDLTAPLESSTVLVNATSLGGGSSNEYKAPKYKESDGDLTVGSFTIVKTALIGATELMFIIVNKIIEVLDDDFTFNSGTGTITRTNAIADDDVIIVPHKIAV